MLDVIFFFFFKQKTAYEMRISDWSSDVCSSDLLTKGTLVELSGRVSTRAWTGNDGEPRAGLNFHTSQIKLHGGSRKAETVQATAKTDSNKTAEQIGREQCRERVCQ